MVYTPPPPEQLAQQQMEASRQRKQLAQQQMEASRQRKAQTRYDAEPPDTFNPLLSDIVQGKNDVQTVRINTRTIKRRGRTIYEYTGRSDNPAKTHYSEGSAQDISDVANWAIENTKRYLSIGDEDIIILDNKVVQQSSLNPEQLDIAKKVQIDRSTYEYERKKYESRRQEELKSGTLSSSSAHWGSKSPGYVAGVDISPVVTQQLELKRKQLRSGAASWDILAYRQEIRRVESRGAHLPESVRNPTFYGIEGAPGYRTSQAENDKRIADINKQVNIPDTYFKNNMDLMQYPNTPIDYGSGDNVRSETELKGLPLGIMSVGEGIDKTIQGLPLQGVIKGVGRGVAMLGTGVVATGAAVAVTIPITIERIKKGTFIDSMKQLPGATIKEAESSIASAVNAVVQTPDIGEKIGLAGTLIGATLYGTGIKTPKIKGFDTKGFKNFAKEDTAALYYQKKLSMPGERLLASLDKTKDISPLSRDPVTAWQRFSEDLPQARPLDESFYFKKSAKPTTEKSYLPYKTKTPKAQAILTGTIQEKTVRGTGFKELKTKWDEGAKVKAATMTREGQIVLTKQKVTEIPQQKTIEVPKYKTSSFSKEAITVAALAGLKPYPRSKTATKERTKTIEFSKPITIQTVKEVSITKPATKLKTDTATQSISRAIEGLKTPTKEMTRTATKEKTRTLEKTALKVKTIEVPKLKMRRIAQLSDQTTKKKSRKGKRSSAWQVKNPFITLKDI